jgi:hypothetical protein
MEHIYVLNCMLFKLDLEILAFKELIRKRIGNVT